MLPGSPNLENHVSQHHFLSSGWSASYVTEQHFSGFKVYVNNLGIRLTCRFAFSRLWLGPTFLTSSWVTWMLQVRNNPSSSQGMELKGQRSVFRAIMGTLASLQSLRSVWIISKFCKSLGSPLHTNLHEVLGFTALWACPTDWWRVHVWPWPQPAHGLMSKAFREGCRQKVNNYAGGTPGNAETQAGDIQHNFTSAWSIGVLDAKKSPWGPGTTNTIRVCN